MLTRLVTSIAPDARRRKLETPRAARVAPTNAGPSVSYAAPTPNARQRSAPSEKPGPVTAAPRSLGARATSTPLAVDGAKNPTDATASANHRAANVFSR